MDAEPKHAIQSSNARIGNLKFADAMVMRRSQTLYCVDKLSQLGVWVNRLSEYVTCELPHVGKRAQRA
jgi:hypothetical protein